MTWLSFFIGVLVGWIIEWIIDLFYWRRAYQSWREENETLQTRLDEADRRIAMLRVKGWEPESEQRIPPAPVAAEQVALVPPDADLDVEALQVGLPEADLEVDLDATEVEAPKADVDNLFDGLKAHFPDVDLDGSIERLKARFPDLDLKTALQGLKADFPDLDIDGAFHSLKARFPDLGTRAAVGSMVAELGERHAELPAVVPQQRPDDLKKIEGIGPKISQLLQDNGIVTFAQLANTSTDRLQAVLQAGGPRYQLADPSTWPEQAELAAGGAWDELQVLQDRLTGGRKGQRRAQ
jgi:predicted flap endonuclease-1-like 5' DNA nuclease